MTHATATLRHAPTGDDAPIPYVLTERAEARFMLHELRRILARRGDLNLSELERRMAWQGTPVAYRTLLRWFVGDTTPATVTAVENVARAAGVDRAYLIVGGNR